MTLAIGLCHDKRKSIIPGFLTVHQPEVYRHPSNCNCGHSVRPIRRRDCVESVGDLLRDCSRPCRWQTLAHVCRQLKVSTGLKSQADTGTMTIHLAAGLDLHHMDQETHQPIFVPYQARDRKSVIFGCPNNAFIFQVYL